MLLSKSNLSKILSNIQVAIKIPNSLLYICIFISKYRNNWVITYGIKYVRTIIVKSRQFFKCDLMKNLSKQYTMTLFINFPEKILEWWNNLRPADYAIRSYDMLSDMTSVFVKKITKVLIYQSANIEIYDLIVVWYLLEVKFKMCHYCDKKNLIL